MDRAPDFESVGWGFESLQARLVTGGHVGGPPLLLKVDGQIWLGVWKDWLWNCMVPGSGWHERVPVRGEPAKK